MKGELDFSKTKYEYKLFYVETSKLEAITFFSCNIFIEFVYRSLPLRVPCLILLNFSYNLILFWKGNPDKEKEENFFQSHFKGHKA